MQVATCIGRGTGWDGGGGMGVSRACGRGGGGGSGAVGVIKTGRRAGGVGGTDLSSSCVEFVHMGACDQVGRKVPTMHVPTCAGRVSIGPANE